MKIERRQVIFGLTLTVLAAGTWWFQHQSETEEEFSNKGDLAPDSIVSDFEVTTMGVDGKPHRRLIAKTMRRYEGQGHTALTEPVLTVYENNNPLWQVQSETGLVMSEKDIVKLRGNVRLHQRPSEGTQDVKMLTEELSIHTKKEFAETDQFVELFTGKDRLSGVGMQVWFNGPIRLKLLSRVRAHYEIKH